MEKRELLRPIALGAVLALGGCAMGGRGEVTSPVTTSVAASTQESTPGVITGPQTTTSEAAGQDVMFQFDYRGQGSTIIETYAGPGESSSDRQPNGTFNHGEVRPVECKTTGRRVPVPKLPKGPNETTKPKDWTSKEWVRLGGFPVRYATLAYGDLVPAGATVKDC